MQVVLCWLSGRGKMNGFELWVRRPKIGRRTQKARVALRASTKSRCDVTNVNSDDERKEKGNYFSTPSILSSTSMYRFLRRSMFSSDVSQYPRPLASRKFATILRNEFGLVSMRRFCISGSFMYTSLASSYTQLSTCPEVADHPRVLFSRFWISRVPSYPDASMPSYHFGFNSLVRESRRTVSESDRTCAFAVVVSAMNDAGIFPSLRWLATSFVGSLSK
mmetsp:Transcript_10727/g.35458  ORF Transcript_10727/g.35458 Transcript_10727/m.35458 type:complete len:220 (+) Transcript_10727:40-699(+)